MTTSLPQRPDLSHLKRQAKNLLKAQQQGDAHVCPILRQLYRFSNSSDAEILQSELKLNEVQFTLALEYGFTSWNALKHHIEQTTFADGELVVHQDNGEVWIDSVPKLSWSDPGDCTFIGALLRALNRIGEHINYTDLMGISGAAFRFCFAHPTWDFSSVDGMLGYDHGQAAMDALGYEGGWAEGENEIRAAITKSIDQGRPALGIDLVTAPEWGVITGYADEGKTLLCRSYFDEPGDDYTRTERLPWLNYIIGERKRAQNRPESLLASLRIAVIYARGEEFVSMGGTSYKRGLNGFETWIADLLDESRFDPNDQESFGRYADVNRFIFDSLFDAREAAARYLASHSGLLGPDFQISLRNLAGLYGRIVAALRDCEQYIPAYENSADWTSDMRRVQAISLQKVIAFEREALDLSEQILKKAV